MSFPGIQVSMDADQHPREWHKPWGGEAFPLFPHAAGLDSILLVTAAGEELSPLFPAAQMEIEDGRTEQARLQCAKQAHGKFLTHLGVPPPGHRHYTHKHQLSRWRRVPRREVKEKQATTFQISSQLFCSLPLNCDQSSLIAGEGTIPRKLWLPEAPSSLHKQYKCTCACR